MSIEVRSGRLRTGRSLSQSLSPMLAFCLLFVVGCGGSQTSPVAPSAPIVQSVTPPVVSPLLCVSGQSNAVRLLPYLGTPTTATYGGTSTNQTLAFTSPTVQGWAIGGQTIYYWLEEGRIEGAGWTALAPFLTPACQAFVWSQGEADEDLLNAHGVPPGAYTATFTTLIGKVRGLTSSALPVLVVQLAPRFVQMRAEQLAACSSVPTCRLIPTDDLTFPDGTHLSEASYQRLADRIVAAVR